MTIAGNCAPLGELIEDMRLRAELASVANPAQTVMASEPLRFVSAVHAYEWIALNNVPMLRPAVIVGDLCVAPVAIGVYEHVIQWPAGA